MNKFYKGVIFALLSATGFGVMPIFAKYAYQTGINLTTLLFLRFLMATTIFFGYIFIKKIKANVTGLQLASLFLLGGVGYTLQAALYFSAVKYIPATMVALLLYTYPVFVAILSTIFEKEALTKQIIVSIGISFAGLVLVLGSSLGKINLVGMILGVGAGFVYSGYIIIGNRVVQKLPNVIVTAYITLFAAFSFLVSGLFTGNLKFNINPEALLPILGIVIFSTVIAMFTFFCALENIGSTKASIISMFEPLVTCFFSAWLFSERFTWLQIIGGLAVLGGAVLVVSAQGKKKLEHATIDDGGC